MNRSLPDAMVSRDHHSDQTHPVASDNTSQMPRDQVGAREFSQLGLLDYLKLDRRPTFVLDLTSTTIPDGAPWPSIAFSNDALTSCGFLYEPLISIFGATNSTSASRDESFPFRTWFDSNNDPSMKRDLSCEWHGYYWSSTSMDQRWLVISGVEIGAISSPHTAVIPNQAFGMQNNSSVSSKPLNRAPEVKNTSIESLETKATSHNSIDLGDKFPSTRIAASEHFNFIRNFNWAGTSLGPIETWSSQLRQACEMMLANPDPCTIFWGEELIMIWNEPYIAVAGNKHPSMFGRSARVSWGEVWDQYDPLFSEMRQSGIAFKQENSRLFVNRKGYLEEGYFNLTVIPILGGDGSVAGFYEPVLEMTRQALSERRMQILLKMSEVVASSASLEDLWRLLLIGLSGHESDIFFAALYSVTSLGMPHDAENEYVFEGGVGLNRARSSDAGPPGSESTGVDELLPALQKARATKSSVVLHATDHTLSDELTACLTNWGLTEPCRSIFVSPLASGTDGSVTAVLAIGTSPRREYDDDYQLFIQLLVRQIESTITFVKSFEKEKALLLEQAAYENDVRFKLFAERAQVGIFIFDPEGRVKFCNDAWIELCGIDVETINEPMCWVDTVHPDMRDQVRGYWHELANAKEPQTFEVQYNKPWRPSGGTKSNMYLDRTYVVASAYAEFSENGELSGMMGCCTDISHTKWAEKIQSQRLSEALELKRQQENFLDITSHEMRNPLNAILHCASELMDQLTNQMAGTFPAEKRIAVLNDCFDAASTIVYCGKHQKRIIDDILTMSKLDSDLLSICPLQTRPPEIVQQVLEVFETELRATKVETVTELTDSYRELAVNVVLLDPHRVIQIIINLFSNAIKFMKGEALRNLRIIVGASTTEPVSQPDSVQYVHSGRHRRDPTAQADWGTGEVLFLTFSVQDTGPGMTPDEAKSLFNRFIQGSPRTHAQYGGSGLGLFISRELAELHGGRIGISSQVGYGSTFDFYVKGRRDLSGALASASLGRTKRISDQSRLTPVARVRDTDVRAPGIKTVNSSPSVMQLPHVSAQRVLIVEDNLINQNILKKIMRKNGYEVSIANHGEEALAVIETSRWHTSHQDDGLKLDLVLCDVEMPVLDGKATVRRIRECQSKGILSANIPVIAVTGNARSEQIKAAKDCGFDDVVSKPYEVVDLMASVKKFSARNSTG